MAKWEIIKGIPTTLTPSGSYYRCDRCGYENTYGPAKYCMNCGAHMENARQYAEGRASFEEDEEKWK